MSSEAASSNASVNGHAAAAAIGADAGAPVSDDAPHILCVDDDKRISDLVKEYLQRNGYRVSVAYNAESARASMKGLAFDLIILDVMMPGESGVEFARSLRSEHENDIPILMLTARVEQNDRIIGLEAGVDDYLGKPFEPRELLLRIQAILKRIDTQPDAGDEVRMGEFVFHVSRGELKRGDESVKLTERERDLLRQFAQRPGEPIARHELVASSDSTGTERAVDVQINRLRRKIEIDPSNPIYLQTVRGKGYILHAE